MFRALVAVSVVAGLAVSGAAAQTQTQAATDLSAATPQENAAGGSVSQRAPSTWVRAAITRHSDLQALRLTGPRFGQPNTEEASLRFSGNSTATSTTTGGLGGLLDLLNQLGGTGSLGNLVGGLTGGTTGSTTGGVTIPAPSNGSSYTLADLIALGQSVGGTQKTNNAPLATLPVDQTASKTGSVTQTRNGITYGGAIARLPKPEERFQSQVATSQPTASFGTRWMTAMADTFFAAIALGMQSDAFVTALEDALRPLVLPTASNTSASDSGTGSGSGSGSGSNGGGIENLSPPTGNSGSSGSTI